MAIKFLSRLFQIDEPYCGNTVCMIVDDCSEHVCEDDRTLSVFLMATAACSVYFCCAA